MLWNRKLINNVNWYIPIVTLLLIAIGILAISSAGELNKESAAGIRLIKKQIISVVLGAILIIIIQFFDYRIFQHYASILYIGTIGVLGIIFIIGTTAKGTTGWLSLGSFNFQPSEMAKVTMILVLAEVIDRYKEELNYFTGLLKPFIHVLIPTLLIILQNDLGTSLVLIFIFIGMLFVGGGNIRFIF
jgi:Bacterial cell division membrane protein